MSKSSANSKSAPALVNICLGEGQRYALTVISDKKEGENATVIFWQATVRAEMNLDEIAFQLTILLLVL